MLYHPRGSLLIAGQQDGWYAKSMDVNTEGVGVSTLLYLHIIKDFFDYFIVMLTD